VIVDAQRLADGPVATVRLPFKIFQQVHGWWVSAGQRPGA
jgi:carotenoid cleavage dioxygenase-like enzyme